MKRSTIIFLMLLVFIACKNDDDDDNSNNPYEELAYYGTTDQNQEITIEIQGNVVNGISAKFIFNIPFGSNTITVDLYDSDGITSFSGSSFTYTFPDPSDNSSVKKGSTISGTLENIRVEGDYSITLKDNNFNIHGTYNTKLN